MPPGDFSDEDMISILPFLTRLEEGQVYLEVGVQYGRSLHFARSIVRPDVEVWGVDLRDDPKIPGTHYIQGDSKIVQFDRDISLLFIDGDHTYEGVKADIDNWVPHVKRGHILFHDCDETSPGVVQAVTERFGATQKLHQKSSLALVTIL